MDLKQIKKIIDLISESDVNEVSIEEGEFKIEVKKQAEAKQQGSSAPVQYQVPPQPAQQASPQPSHPQSSEDDSQTKPEKSGTQEDISGKTVEAPIVGTFYRAPSPDDDPFVSVGDQVEEGQTVCIVEAMKIMNEIESEVSGEIKKILVEDGDAVEFEQPLFIVG